MDAIKSGELYIDPFDRNVVQPASYDIHLGGSFVVYDYQYQENYPVDPTKYNPLGKYLSDETQIVVKSKAFMLGSTIEEVGLCRTLVARVEGVSSLGRIGLAIHSTAGYIDPGFRGQITLELFNMAPYPILLTAGMRIGQLAFERMSGPSSGYSGRYQNQTGATPSRYAAEKVATSTEYL